MTLDSSDLNGFWKDSEYARQEYLGEALTEELVRSVEQQLGFKLPASFLQLMRTQNGGIPARRHMVLKSGSTTEAAIIEISGIFGIGTRNPSTLCGSSGSRFWVEEWGYPPIGIYFADCPSAGHDMVCLDYRACGSLGEPAVSHVDQEQDYRILVLADTFANYVGSLENQVD
jgi:hypothetical protein